MIHASKLGAFNLTLLIWLNYLVFIKEMLVHFELASKVASKLSICTNFQQGF
jgi:hypothetical protein